MMTDTTNSTNERRGIRGFEHRHRQALLYVYVTIAFLLCLWAVQKTGSDARHRDQVRVAEQAHTDCVNRQVGRQALRDTVIIATTAGAPLDLTKLPGFADLDQATQAFFANLAAATTRPTPPAPVEGHQVPDPNNVTQKKVLDQIPDLSCEP